MRIVVFFSPRWCSARSCSSGPERCFLFRILTPEESDDDESGLQNRRKRAETGRNNHPFSQHSTLREQQDGQHSAQHLSLPWARSRVRETILNILDKTGIFPTGGELSTFTLNSPNPLTPRLCAQGTHLSDIRHTRLVHPQVHPGRLVPPQVHTQGG